MGSRQSRSHDNQIGAEMASGQQFKDSGQPAEPLAAMEELLHELDALKAGVTDLAASIEDVFRSRSQEDAQDLEDNLQSSTRVNQRHIKRLTRQLERHAKMVTTQGREANEQVMAAVIDLVTTVNQYMTMLIRNIRKLKRLLSESEQQFGGGGKSDLYHFWQKGQRVQRQENPIYDVINDHQDVDAMLAQLLQTEAHREELESDIVSVLVCWRDFHVLRTFSEERAQEAVDEIEKDVLAAADSVAHGLAQLNCHRRAYDVLQLH